MQEQADSILARVSHDLSELEKRDWGLWIIVSFTGVIVGGGLLAILFPAAFFEGDNIHFELTVSRQLVVGLIALLILLNTYVVTRRLELRRGREKINFSTNQWAIAPPYALSASLTVTFKPQAP